MEISCPRIKRWDQLQGGNLKDARSTFKELTDDANTPNNLRRRASEILKALP